MTFIYRLHVVAKNFFIEPKIISAPSACKPFTTTKDEVFLSGCRIATHFNLSSTTVYWLENGLEKTGFTSSGNIPEGGSVFQLTGKDFEVEPQMKFTIQGYYQCAVFDTRYMKEEVRSERLDVQFHGNIFI